MVPRTLPILAGLGISLPAIREIQSPGGLFKSWGKHRVGPFPAGAPVLLPARLNNLWNNLCPLGLFPGSQIWEILAEGSARDIEAASKRCTRKWHDRPNWYTPGLNFSLENEV